MSMTDAERQAFGQRVQEVRNGRFGGEKRRAYEAIGLNSQTYDNIEAGVRARPHTIVKVVNALWPTAHGDWQEVLAGVAEEPTTATHNTHNNDDDRVSNADILAAVHTMHRDLDRRLSRLEHDTDTPPSGRPSKVSPTPDTTTPVSGVRGGVAGIPGVAQQEPTSNPSGRRPR